MTDQATDTAIPYVSKSARMAARASVGGSGRGIPFATLKPSGPVGDSVITSHYAMLQLTWSQFDQLRRDFLELRNAISNLRSRPGISPTTIQSMISKKDRVKLDLRQVIVKIEAMHDKRCDPTNLYDFVVPMDFVCHAPDRPRTDEEDDLEVLSDIDQVVRTYRSRSMRAISRVLAS